jgi:hypothetical protein
MSGARNGDPVPAGRAKGVPLYFQVFSAELERTDRSATEGPGPEIAVRDISTTSKADHRLRLEAAHGMERRAATLAKDTRG